MDKITVITLTGDRNKVFELVRQHISAQTIQPDQWIIVDDGFESLPERLIEGADYIRREPKKGEGFTLIQNMKLAVSQIKGDIILFFEDDDYYAPNYIETYYNYLKKYALVGEGCARYYHVPAQKHARLSNRKHASLAQTGFRKELLEIFKSTLVGDPYVDLRFWQKAFKYGYLFFDTEDKLRLHCSLKGLPGRKGIGIGHNENYALYKYDKDYRILKKWIGEETALKCIKLIGE